MVNEVHRLMNCAEEYEFDSEWNNYLLETQMVNKKKLIFFKELISAYLYIKRIQLF